MENTKKMILVDPETIQRIQQQTHANSFNTNSISAIDSEMDRILNIKNISDSDKWRLYSQVLHRFLHFAGESRKPLSISVNDQHAEREDLDKIKVETNNLRTDMLEAIPITFRNKARIMYDKLESNDNITWDRYGSVIMNGKKIPGSSITDLIADAVRDRGSTNPPGWSEFADVLYTINMPQELIGNTRRKDFILQKHRDPETPVPPTKTAYRYSPKRKSLRKRKLVVKNKHWESFTF